MKTTTKTTNTVISCDYEVSTPLFNRDNLTLYGAAAAGGKSISSICNLFGNLTAIAVTKKILRTKVKKGCNKGKTRVTVCTLK